eukprot:GILJ01029778.1.p1 GENE.GILJ01029778.1~~GILJ01029778.1.p1  ORF type:complete len:185 (+),score=28.36 GILJ01029778.1:58-555(+)
MAVSTTMEHRLLAWNLPMVKEVVLQAVASGHLTLKGRQVDRSAAWTAIASFKGSAVRNKYEWVATEERRAEHKLFEYGWPGTGEVAERSKYYKRIRATADAWEDVPVSSDIDPQQDLIEEEDTVEDRFDSEDFTPAELGTYYEELSDREDEEEQTKLNKQNQPVL